MIFLIALRAISTLTRGSPLKRSSYSGFETDYRACVTAGGRYRRSRCRGQVVRWSLTMPEACMKA